MSYRSNVCNRRKESPETAGKSPTAKTAFNGINHECHYSRTITTEEKPAIDGKATTVETETKGMQI